ncbi:nuclear cap-binding protein subunit 3-like [Aricia agestis]|uniref:nuclear cap-binding protein subunit 3-like n=1 Tax=Aricia agestis TaxID=91739 RepID=UPI001C209F85|nr:nuclear cap-binding protein subunit 3-like [Aricia agestis]
MEQERDFEMSDGEMMDTDDETEKVVEQGPDPKSTIFYKADKNGLMLKELDKIDAVKLEERAKRFGINLSGSRLVTQKQIDELYKNFGIESGNERHFRFDALHLNGVHGLTTKDIFEYLQDYKPVSLEWVDENSCNVICQDHISVAMALLVHSREIISEEIKDMISKRSSYHWREGMPHPQVDMIFMRFATNSDKKNPKKVPEQKLKSRVFERMDVNYGQTKNPWGDLCQSWGVYDHQEIFQRRLVNNKEESFETNSDEERPYKPIKIKNEKLAKRLGKRNHIPSDEIDSDSDSEWKSKSKTPRMRMHADDEESKIKKISQVEKNDEDEDDDDERDFAPLSIEVLNKKSIFRPRESKVLSEKFKRTPQKITASIQSRLGVKVATDADLSSEDSLSDSDHNVMSRVQKVKKGHSNSVWSRLEVKASNSTEHDLRQMLKTKKNKSNESTSLKSNDLRKRLGKPKTNLRIEIDNS